MKLLYDTVAKYKNKDIKVKIYDSKISLQKKKLFFKDYKEIESIIINDDLSIRSKGLQIILDNSQKEVELEFKNIIEVSKVKNKINNAINKTDFFKKSGNALNTIIKNKDLILTGLGILIALFPKKK